MYNLSDAINTNIEELNTKIIFIENELQKMPGGWLQVNKNKSGNVFFRHVESINKLPIRRLVKKNDVNFIVALSSKAYYKKLLPLLRKELAATQTFQNSFDPLKKYEVYRDLHPEKQKFVKPLFETVHSRVEAWKAAPYRPLVYKGAGAGAGNGSRYGAGAGNGSQYGAGAGQENALLFDTEHGEKVRSKSEYMIANELHRRSGELLYRYEQELRLSDGVVYPDFEIISLKTGKVYYYEHFGRMDDGQYLEGFIRKIQRYTKSGIFLGQNLIATFESNEKPLHLSQIKAALEIIE